MLVRGTVRRRARVSAAAARRLRRGGARRGTVRARWFRARAAMAEGVREGERGRARGPAAHGDGRDARARPPDGRHRGAGRARRRRGSACGRATPLVEGVAGRALERLTPRRCPPAGPTDDRRAVAGGDAPRLGLPSLAEALGRVHAPAREAAAPAGELGAGAPPASRSRRCSSRSSRFSCAARRRRRARSGRRRLPRGARARLEAALAFALTPSQARALDEIAADLGRPAPDAAAARRRRGERQDRGRLRGGGAGRRGRGAAR